MFESTADLIGFLAAIGIPVFFAIFGMVMLKKPKKQKAAVGTGFQPEVDKNGDVWQRTLGQVPPWMK